MTEGGMAFKPGFLDTITGGEYSKKATRMKSLGFDRDGNERPKQAANPTWKFESADVLDTKLQVVVVSPDWKFKDFKNGQTGGMAIANLISPIPLLES